MNEVLRYRVIDAFAHAPYTGNPAGVVFEADGLSDAQMVAVAREINASETAFIGGRRGADGAYGLRWFSPTREVQFCGHATLAAASGLLMSEVLRLDGRTDGPTVAFETAAGRLALTAEVLPAPDRGPLWWLEMPEPGLRPDGTNPLRTCQLLGTSIDELDPAAPLMRTRDDDVILFVRSWTTLTSLRPDFHGLAAWCEQHGIRGVCVATTHTLDRSTHVHSRFFAPAVGIPEDPVTGSVHGPLATLLVIHELIPMSGNRAAVQCIQGVPGGRTGLVRALVERAAGRYAVRIAGRCYATLSGELRVPPPQ